MEIVYWIGLSAMISIYLVFGIYAGYQVIKRLFFDDGKKAM